MAKIPLIAIVDDDEEVREALCELLIVAGFTSHTFDSAVTFLAGRGICDFDCIVTDIHMPAMSGLELIARLHAEGANPPIVVLSSIRDDQVRRQALALGICTWLSKPVRDERLLEAIETAIIATDRPNGNPSDGIR